MTKYRKLHTQILESPDFVDMPDDFTRVTWVLLMLILDSKGRAQDSARFVLSKMYPTREDISVKQVQEALDYYARRGMITRYEVGGRKYFYQTKFQYFQGDTGKEAKSLYPDPPTDEVPEPEPQPVQDDTPKEVESNASVTQDLSKRNSLSYTTTTTTTNTDSDSDSNADADTDTTTGAAAPAVEVVKKLSFANILKVYMAVNKLEKVNDDVGEGLEFLFDIYGGDKLEYAIREARLRKHKDLPYIEGVAKNYVPPNPIIKAGKAVNKREVIPAWGN